MPIPTDLLATITAPLEGGRPDDARRIWRTLQAKLDPLLGPLSNQLLFARSLEAHQADFPWLPPTATLTAQEVALTVFEHALDALAPGELVRANRVLLETYTQALCELIGVSLATRFLRSAFPDSSAR